VNLLLLATLLAAEPRVLDRVAATVNDEWITLSELEDRAGSEYRKANEAPPSEARDRARGKLLRAAFDVLVAEKLLEQQITALQIEVSDGEIDGAIEDIKRRNNMTDAQLSAALNEQGMTREVFRKSLKKQLEGFRILGLKVKSRVKVTDEDLKNFYQSHPKQFAGEDEVHVRHIFLSLDPKAKAADEAAVRARGDKLLARIRAGEDFAKLAREESNGPSAKEGGDLGFLKRDSLQQEMKGPAFGLKVGEVSGLVKTKFGYHILKVEERRVGVVRPFEEVKEDIRDRLTNEQLATYQDQYVAELRRDAAIETRIPELQEPGAR
jgi:peptidyl-prolyl cis-trans isomerase SurA